MKITSEIDQVKLEKIADCEHEIFALLKQRYSPRTFAEEPLKDHELQQLFEAARWTASSYNWQPWRFIYAKKDSDSYNKIMDCLSDFNKKWAGNAPLLMLTAYKKENPDGNENFHALHDLGQAVANMAIQGQYMGIGLHQMAGVDWKKAHDIFHISEDYHVTTAVAIGYYGGDVDRLPQDLKDPETAPRERIPQKEFAFEGEWKQA